MKQFFRLSSLFFLIALVGISSLCAAPSLSNNGIPLTTDYPPPFPKEPQKNERNQYKTAAAVLLGTAIAITLGLLVSGADTGKRASSSSSSH